MMEYRLEFQGSWDLSNWHISQSSLGPDESYSAGSLVPIKRTTWSSLESEESMYMLLLGEWPIYSWKWQESGQIKIKHAKNETIL